MMNEAITLAMATNSISFVKSILFDTMHTFVLSGHISTAIQYARTAVNTFPNKPPLQSDHIQFGLMLTHFLFLADDVASALSSLTEFEAKLTASSQEQEKSENASPSPLSLYAALLRVALIASTGAVAPGTAAKAEPIAAAAGAGAGGGGSGDAKKSDTPAAPDTAALLQLHAAEQKRRASTTSDWLNGDQCLALHQLLLAVGFRTSSELTPARQAQKQSEDTLKAFVAAHPFVLVPPLAGQRISFSAAALSKTYRYLFAEAKANAFTTDLTSTDYFAAGKALSELIDAHIDGMIMLYICSCLLLPFSLWHAAYLPSLLHTPMVE